MESRSPRPGERGRYAPKQVSSMDGFFLTADLLGFSNVINNSNDNEVSARVDAWTSLVDAAAQEAGVQRLQLISDTVFAGSDSTAEGLTSMVSFACALLNKGARSSLPVRGGITHGSFEWGRLTYGKAVIKSHQLESKQDWIGIACEGNLPHVEKMWRHDGLVCYPPPFKSGSVMLHPVVSWDVPDFESLTKSLTSNGLTRQGEQLSWPWAQKVSNTIEFRTYLEIVRQSKADPSKFIGMLPMHVIALNVRPANDRA